MRHYVATNLTRRGIHTLGLGFCTGTRRGGGEEALAFDNGFDLFKRTLSDRP